VKTVTRFSTETGQRVCGVLECLLGLAHEGENALAFSFSKMDWYNIVRLRYSIKKAEAKIQTQMEVN